MIENVIYKNSNGKILSKLVQNEINNNSVTIESQWEMMDMPEACSFIKQWRSREFRIEGQNRQSSIIKEISHISFPNLRLIALWRNKIRSIEDLCKVDFPSVQWINLGLNEISNVDIVKKISWPSLHQIHFHNNYIQAFSQITKMKADKVTSIGMEWQIQEQEQGPSYHWQAKLETGSLSLIYSKSEKRIKLSKLAFVLKRKHVKK